MPNYPVGKLPAAHLTRLLNTYAPLDSRVVAGPAIGADAAIIEMDNHYLVAKTDPITFATDLIGWYAVNINANDVVCTGAMPRWFLATLLLPENETTPALVDHIFEQIGTACRELGVSLVGGHTEITHGLHRPIVVGHMLGEVEPEQMVTIKGTQVGDDLILTKGIAIEATALIATEMRAQLVDHFDADSLNAYANFIHQPGISVVNDALVAMASGGVHAMHDPTEGGIATALHELAQAAEVGLDIDEERLPYLPETVALCRHFGLDPLGIIASGALLIAADPHHSPDIVSHLDGVGINASIIGKTTPLEQGRWLRSRNGTRPLPTFTRDEITRLFD